MSPKKYTPQLPAEFMSGNDVPVERAIITRTRMQEILIDTAKEALSSAVLAVDESSELPDLPDAVEHYGSVFDPDAAERIVRAAKMRRAAVSAAGASFSDLYPAMSDKSQWTLYDKITALPPIDHLGGPSGDEPRYVITAEQLDHLVQIESAAIAALRGSPASESSCCSTIK